MNFPNKNKRSVKSEINFNWSDKYGSKHRWNRILDFPTGIKRPKKVRIYQRTSHFILQWWDPAAKKNLSVRVDGDLVSAIMKAREIEEKLEHFQDSGLGKRRLNHSELVKKFLVNLQRRANADEISPKTVSRYESALSHYLRFTEDSAISRAFPSATNVNRDFSLQFAEYLQNLQISPNGHANTSRRPVRSPHFILDIVRTMMNWAADPDRGNLMPGGFRNPFLGKKQRRNQTAVDLFGEPDITMTMAAEFLKTCDEYQLPLFTMLALYGLRASEPCLLFHEHIEDSWLKVVCDPELDYTTKGMRDKRLPLSPELAGLFRSLSPEVDSGLLFVRRAVFTGDEKPQLFGASQAELHQEYKQRCQKVGAPTAQEKLTIRNRLLKEAGGLNYDQLEREFHLIAKQLNWPATATLKDFRHLFSTSMQNAGMPEYYRKYLMGHSVGKAAIIHYTHLNQLRQRYEEAASHQLASLIEVVQRRSADLSLLTAA